MNPRRKRPARLSTRRTICRPAFRGMLATLLLLARASTRLRPPMSSLRSPPRPGSVQAQRQHRRFFDPKLHPEATVVHPVDPHTLSESQLKFGVAPKRDPKVEYQPDIILMENGDKAIKSVASDGLTWTFDANAPQVSDFQEGKIVFATGRAVGRVLEPQAPGRHSERNSRPSADHRCHS